MGKPYNLGAKALLLTVQLADFQSGADGAVVHVHTGQRNGFTQER